MAKNVERLRAREAKELIRREKQLGARSNKFYFLSVTLLIIFYRPLADKFGRKPFLVINTLCMGLGLFLGKCTIASTP